MPAIIWFIIGVAIGEMVGAFVMAAVQLSSHISWDQDEAEEGDIAE